MQRMVFKIIGISLLYFTAFVAPSFSQDFRQQIDVADSLFKDKKYTQSYELYDSIYSLGNFVSPAMLLKMAYIREGLGDYTMALYLLYDYYVLTSDEYALEKMESLASARNLVGYEYSEKDYVISVYHKYYDEIILSLSALSFLFLSGLVYQKFRNKTRPLGNFILLSISSLSLIYVINLGMGDKEAIVIHQNTYLMDSPSSAGNVVDIIGEGHKIVIAGSKDVWIKTTWNDQIVFVKRKNVLPIKSWWKNLGYPIESSLISTSRLTFAAANG